MYKVFPYTRSGDRLRVEFEYDEEGEAFNSVLEKLHTFLTKNRSHSGSRINNFSFETTLEYNVAKDNGDVIMEIFGLNHFELFSRSTTIIIKNHKDWERSR